MNTPVLEINVGLVLIKRAAFQPNELCGSLPAVLTSVTQMLELSPKLRQSVKTHFSLNGELSYGNFSTEVHEGV